jgi:hypothetical protein
MPVVEDVDEFATDLAQLRRLREDAGRPDIEVTVCAWEPGEQLLARCAELGATRCAVVAPAHDLATFQAFLDSYARIANRVG